MSQDTLTLELRDNDEAQALSGPRDRHLRLLRERLAVELVLRGLALRISGADAKRAHALLSEVLGELRQGVALQTDEVEDRINDSFRGAGQEERTTSGRLSRIEGFRLRTEGQRRYVNLMNEHELVFSVGPAGTGKTFLAVLKAVQELKAGKIQRIILCRPAVEAGESLGFLPGDFQAKVNPYMRPLYDALYTVLDFETVKRFQEREVVEVAPLAYMRGRTLQDAFVILDEAQNTTKAQMKMFLTRMGERSRIVVTGDVTQVDLPKGVTSGLIHALSILKKVKEIGFAELTGEDIVRHRLVWQVIQAYEGRGARRS